MLVAAGRSSRMGTHVRKPLVDLAGRPVLVRAAAALAEAPSVRRIVVVAHPEDVQVVDRLFQGSRELAKVEAILPGGAERIDSVRIGAAWPCDGADIVLIHDAARPLVTPAAVEAVARAAKEHGAALLAVPVLDTLKRSSDGKRAEATVERTHLWNAQTPQGFRIERFRAILEHAQRDGFRPTDDAALWERYEGPVEIVPGEPTNLKITQIADIDLARAVIEAREHRSH